MALGELVRMLFRLLFDGSSIEDDGGGGTVEDGGIPAIGGLEVGGGEGGGAHA